MVTRELKKLFDYVETCDIVDELYTLHCLVCSGFDKELAYKYLYTILDMYIKDETGMSIPTLCDGLYELYEDGENIDIPIKELLHKIYIIDK